MNISSTGRYGETRTSENLAPKARFDKTLFSEPQGKKMDHTPFRGPKFLDSFWESMRSLPKPQQVNLATSILALQLAQTGITDENKGFIKRFKSRFSPEEMGTIKNLLRTQPLSQVTSASQVEKWVKELDELWSDRAPQKAEKRPPLTPKSPLFQTPEAIFFQTTFDQRKNGTPVAKRVEM